MHLYNLAHSNANLLTCLHVYTTKHIAESHKKVDDISLRSHSMDKDSTSKSAPVCNFEITLTVRDSHDKHCF